MMSDLDLDLYGDDEHPAAYDDTPTAIIHTDDDWERHATWHMRLLGEQLDRMGRVRQVFADQIRVLEDRMDGELAKIQKKVTWHETTLKQLHADIIAADPKRKTIVLPHGTMSSTTPATPKVKVTDPDAFMMWAHEHAPHLLALTYKPDSKAIALDLKDVLKATADPAPGEAVSIVTAAGEMVPGVELALGQPSFRPTPEGVI
jgi:hypothetical protein